jgi:hypothetical protein
MHKKIEVDVVEAKKFLNELQKEKLWLASQIFKKTATLYPQGGNPSLLPLWAAGVVTHGQPNTKHYEIGTTLPAKTVEKKATTRDHLYRVTATAEFILKQANELSVEDIGDILLIRSIKMRTTRSENNNQLKNALTLCRNTDDWQELYGVAEIKYELCLDKHPFIGLRD